MSLPTLRLAVAQSAAIPLDIPANLRSAERAITAAAGGNAALVLFPELSLTGYELDGIACSPEAWLAAGDARLDAIRALCRERHIAAVLGAPWRDGDGRPRLAALMIGPDGEIYPHFKQYLHGRENDIFVAGTPAPPFLLRQWRIALAICFDVAHPAHAAAAAAHGADLYLVSAFYTVGEERRCDLHLGARAMDNRMFAALANYAGVTAVRPSCGLSGVWLPSGAILRRAPSSAETLLFADLTKP